MVTLTDAGIEMGMDSHDNGGYSDSCPPANRQKGYQPGYSTVLIQAATKDALRAYRLHAFGTDTHIERCLVTAAVELLLKDKSLHDRWFEAFRDVVQTDMLLAMDYRRNRTR